MSYYGYDGHGSVRFLTDSSGMVTDTDTYDALSQKPLREMSRASRSLIKGACRNHDLG